MIMLAARHHDLPAVLCTLLYVVAVIATVVAVVLLLLSLFGPQRGNWLYAAAVALVGWLLLLFLC
jgi:uncharacterized membrane protein